MALKIEVKSVNLFLVLQTAATWLRHDCKKSNLVVISFVLQKFKYKIF